MTDSSVLSSYKVEKEGGFPFYVFADRQVVMYAKGIHTTTNVTFQQGNMSMYHSRNYRTASDPLSKAKNLELYRNIARCMISPIGMIMYYRINDTDPIGLFYAKNCKIEYVGSVYARIYEPLRSHLFRFPSTVLRDSFCNSIRLLKGTCGEDVLQNSNFDSLVSSNCTYRTFNSLSYLRENPEINSDPITSKVDENQFVESIVVPLDNSTSRDEAIDMESPQDTPLPLPSVEDVANETDATVVDDDDIQSVKVVDGNLKIATKSKSIKSLKRLFTKNKSK